MRNGTAGSDDQASTNEVSLFSMPKGLDLTTHKTVRIAVSGDVLLNRLETTIVDTREFQRLRRIKELGTTYLVYPTALHTRFDHSLGTLYMAMQMARAIRENEHSHDDEKAITQEQEQLIRLLALLHDITHIPFGHTLEDESCIFDPHDKDSKRREYFLGRDSAIGKILIECLGNDLYDRFMSIYGADKDNLGALGDDLFVYDLVNNTVCADLLDYLRRDSYFCNVVLDMDYRFLKFLYLHRDGTKRRLAVRLWKEGEPSPRRDVLSELTRLLDNRYLLGERVYFHHAKLVTGAMVSGAVQRAVEGKKARKADLYDVRNKNKRRQTVGDEALLDRLESCGVTSVEKLASCLRERKLWKTTYEHSRQTVDAEQARLRDENVWTRIKETWWQDPKRRTQDEDLIAALVGIEPGDVLIHCSDPKMAMKPAGMKVFWNGVLRPLKDCTDDPVVGPKLDVILKSHENLWAIRAFVNPEFSAKSDQVINACYSRFTFSHPDKSRYETLAYRGAVDEIVLAEGWGRDLLQEQYEERAQAAVKGLVEHSNAIRDRATIRKIVEDAFAS